jgi:hypothetical protein
VGARVNGHSHLLGVLDSLLLGHALCGAALADVIQSNRSRLNHEGLSKGGGGMVQPQPASLRE